MVSCLCLCAVVLSFCGVLKLNTSVFTLVSVVFFSAAFILYRAIYDYRSSKEWELVVDSDHIRWIDRDLATQSVVGEVSIKDIRSLIYHGGGDSDPFLEIEFTDASIRQLPSRGILKGDTLIEFIDYWTTVHSDIPIRNVNPA